MPRSWLLANISRLLASVATVCALGPRGPAAAGAFLQPEGQGQFIAGVGYSEGSRRFDPSGRVVAGPPADKVEASGYLEYGLTSWLSLIAAPTLARETGALAANTVTGSDSSAFGARLQLYALPDRVIAVQVLVQPPLGGSGTAVVADGGSRAFAVDLRVLGGRSFPLLGMPAFVDVQPGTRLRADPLPAEARLDMTFGLRPVPSLLVLIQDFNSLAPRAGALVPSTSYAKLQGSLVYDLSRRWSAQVGAFRTIAGRNALRETGPLVAIWYRWP